MSCIHYKFRSALEYDTITFDGLSISLADLKQSIITQKKFGKNTDFDLEVTNAQTKEGELFFVHSCFLVKYIHPLKGIVFQCSWVNAFFCHFVVLFECE